MVPAHCREVQRDNAGQWPCRDAPGLACIPAEKIPQGSTVDEQERRLKYNHLLTNAVAIQNVIGLTRAVRQLVAEGYPVKREDLAAFSPYQTRHIKRFGDYVFTVTAPEPFDADLITPFSPEAVFEEQPAIA